MIGGGECVTCVKHGVLMALLVRFELLPPRPPSPSHISSQAHSFFPRNESSRWHPLFFTTYYDVLSIFFEVIIYETLSFCLNVKMRNNFEIISGNSIFLKIILTGYTVNSQTGTLDCALMLVNIPLTKKSNQPKFISELLAVWGFNRFRTLIP